jgi:cytochrome c oxidase cbb3-type subunit I/II
VDHLKADGIEVSPETEIVALIAYLQRLGKDIKGEKTANK